MFLAISTRIFSEIIFTEEQTRMVSKIKQERCDCQNKEKEINQKMSELEEKYNAQKIQLNKKDREITGHIVENQKLLNLISKLQNNTKNQEYIEVSDIDED